MKISRKCLFGLTLLALLAIGAWAQDKSQGLKVEGRVKKAALHYYLGLLLADPMEYLTGVRTPVQVIRNGTFTRLDETAAKAMVAKLASYRKGKSLTAEDRNQIVKNAIGTLEEADVRFVGANTATVSFLIRKDDKTGGEFLCTLILHRKEPKTGDWQIIQEITDGDPVPIDYVK